MVAATFLDVQTNPYVVLTVQLFRAQLLVARAAGHADQAEAFEAAIRSLLEDRASGALADSTGWPAAAPN